MSIFTIAQRQSKSAQPSTTHSFTRPSRPFAPVAPPIYQPTPVERQGQLEHGVRLRHSFDQLSIFSPHKPMARSADQEGGISSARLIRQAAQAGIQTPARPLPFARQIQQAFGCHQISKIQAHTGQAATASARAMQASAYTTGRHVVFAGTPDLYTAAHEAAHVVQQRDGVQLAGGIGKIGDDYEKHADEVAYRVTSGQSAEVLLNSFAAPDDGVSVRRSSQGTLQGSQMLIQMLDIKMTHNAIVGTYDSLGNLESDYKSDWDQDQRKGFGISYHLVNPKKSPPEVPNPVADAVAHAHILNNGQDTEGISVKKNPGAGGAQWVSPNNLHDDTKKALRNSMIIANPNPKAVNNRRKVSRDTGVWSQDSEPDDGDYVLGHAGAGAQGKRFKGEETVYWHDKDGFINKVKKSAEWLYDAGTGERIKNVWSTATEAGNNPKIVKPIWANGKFD